MIIRSAKMGDTEKIASMHKASIEALCAESYSPENIAGWVSILSPDIYESAIKEKIMIVAEREGRILGMGILNIENKKIGALYIHPKVKGTGVGSRLLQELEAIALKNNIDQLSLSSTINAFSFYTRQGYTGEENEIHELPNGTKLDCIRMYKKLKS